jgi:hypothetical protein
MANAAFMQTLAEKWDEKGRTAQAALLGAGEDSDDGDMIEGDW